MTKVSLVNAVDTYIDSGQPTKNFSTLRMFYTRTGTPTRVSYLFHGLSIPRGVTVLSAKLVLYSAATGSGTVSPRVIPLAQKFDASRTTWNNRPNVGSGSVSVSKTNPAPQSWTFDVTAFIQAVAQGTPWYGFRIDNANMAFHSAQATTAAWRPRLEVEWSDAPQTPTNLVPSNGSAVSLAKPVLMGTFTDLSGDRTMSAIHVQTNTSNSWTSPAYDSGICSATAPQFDLANPPAPAPAHPDITTSETRWWRMRVRDGAGLWSSWSEPVSFIRRAKGTITWVNPPPGGTTFEDTSPPVAWTFSGTQRAYQLAVVTDTDRNTIVYNSGKITSSENNHTVADNKLTRNGVKYVFVLRIWDDIDRQTTPGDPAYAESYLESTLAQTTATSPVSQLTGTATAPRPGMQLDFARTGGDPDWFQLMRDGVYVGRYDPDEVRVSPGVYRIYDYRATARRDHTWVVVSSVNGRLSASNPSYTGRVKMNGPWLMGVFGEYPVGLLNYEVDADQRDGSEVYQPIGDGVDPVMITQGIGGESGAVTGLLADEAGISAEQMLANFKALRRSQGSVLVFHLVNEILEVIVNTLTYSRVPRPNGGVDYVVSFKYWQVNSS